MLNTRPKGDRTNQAHPRCYARGLRDCDAVRTREHYISKALLERIANKITVTGMHQWGGESRQLTPDSIAAKILCERHNNALGSLDDNITRLYDALLCWHDGKPVDCTLDGEDIERWAIKLLIGFTQSGSAAVGGERVTVTEVDERWLRYLFGEEQLGGGAGLYFLGDTPDHMPDHSKLVFHILHREDHANGTPEVVAADVMGIAISMLGFSFATTAAVPMRGFHRPSEFRLGSRGVLRFRWELPNPHAPLIELHRKADQ